MGTFKKTDEKFQTCLKSDWKWWAL